MSIISIIADRIEYSAYAIAYDLANHLTSITRDGDGGDERRGPTTSA